jgi:hypothetical protein
MMFGKLQKFCEWTLPAALQTRFGPPPTGTPYSQKFFLLRARLRWQKRPIGQRIVRSLR